MLERGRLSMIVADPALSAHRQLRIRLGASALRLARPVARPDRHPHALYLPVFQLQQRPYAECYKDDESAEAGAFLTPRRWGTTSSERPRTSVDGAQDRAAARPGESSASTTARWDLA